MSPLIEPAPAQPDIDMSAIANVDDIARAVVARRTRFFGFEVFHIFCFFIMPKIFANRKKDEESYIYFISN